MYTPYGKKTLTSGNTVLEVGTRTVFQALQTLGSRETSAAQPNPTNYQPDPQPKV
jgi:hypothetical protein